MWLAVRASVVGGVVPGKSQWGVLWSCAWVKTLSQVVVGSGGGKRLALWVGVVCGREDDRSSPLCSEITTILIPKVFTGSPEEVKKREGR